MAAHLRQPLVAAARLRARQAGLLRRGALVLQGWGGPDCIEVWTGDRGTFALHVTDHYYAFCTLLADGRVLTRASPAGEEGAGDEPGGFLCELQAHRAAVQDAGTPALAFERLEDHVGALRCAWQAGAGRTSLHARRLLPDPFLLGALAAPLPTALALALPGPLELPLLAQVLWVTVGVELACLLGLQRRTRALIRAQARAAAGMRAGLLA
jgi:hypothetical protein